MVQPVVALVPVMAVLVAMMMFLFKDSKALGRASEHISVAGEVGHALTGTPAPSTQPAPRPALLTTRRRPLVTHLSAAADPDRSG